MTIELYDYEAAASPTKVRWALAEAGLTWTRRRIDFYEFEQKGAAFLTVNPKGEVPVARFDGATVVGAVPIIKRLGAMAGRRRFRVEGAEVDSLLQQVETLHPHYGAVLYAEVFLPMQARRAPADLASALNRIADAPIRERLGHLIKNGVPAAMVSAALTALDTGFAAADRILSGRPWLAGDAVSIADIALFPYVNAPCHAVSDLWFGRRPALEAWLGRMRARPAYMEAVVNHPYDQRVWAAVRQAPSGGGYRAPLPRAA